MYYTPTTKRSGDLQWRLAHEALPPSIFVNRFDVTVSVLCPFYNTNEDVFHGYVDCIRLCALIFLLKNIFDRVNVRFSLRVFIFGLGVASADEKLILFLNYVLSEAKLAIYLSRKAKIKGKPPEQCNVILYFQSLVSTRLKLEFNYYSNNANINGFVENWCVGKMCKVNENDLEMCV